MEAMQPLMQHIVDSMDKWRVNSSEYDRLKEDWIKTYGYEQGFDEFFNANFIILSDREIEIRNERIERRKQVLAKKAELLTEYEKLGKEIEKLSRESTLLLKQINWEDWMSMYIDEATEKENMLMNIPLTEELKEKNPDLYERIVQLKYGEE